MENSVLRVLIAEDDLFVAEVIREEVLKLGASVVGQAADGCAAVDLTCRLKPDVVLMDVQMPRMDGIAAACEIQERCPTPVVMLTVHTEQEVAARAAQAGVGAYLVKPADRESLLRAITVARARFADVATLRCANSELREALASVKTLSGMLPICSSCKKIRDDQGYWRQVEAYVREHSSAEFTHSICPECIETLYPRDKNPWMYPPEDEK